MMRLEVQPDRCIGAGVCALVAGALFDQRDDDGVVVLLDPTPPSAHQEAAREAALRCPAGVITVHEQ